MNDFDRPLEFLYAYWFGTLNAAVTGYLAGGWTKPQLQAAYDTVRWYRRAEAVSSAVNDSYDAERRASREAGR